MLKTGIIGTIITAICCFTPALVWVLAAVGLAGSAIYLDLVLLPLLFIFAGMAIFALWKRGAAEG